MPHIDDFKWTHATIPRRRFGLRDPQTIIQSARLASLTNVSERKGIHREKASRNKEEKLSGKMGKKEEKEGTLAGGTRKKTANDEMNQK